MSNRPAPQPGIEKIAPYVPGRSRLDTGGDAIKLSSNESPLGMSPRAATALESLGQQVAAYPDGASTGLRDAIGAAHNIDPGKIVAGSGSDELLHLLAQAYLGEGDEAVISEYGFLVYPIATNGAGATPVTAPDRDFTVDVDAMLAAVTPRTKIVWIANPNNPTGTYIPGTELRRLADGLRSDILLVIDSAYAEYVTASDFESGAALVPDYENVVMVRTFSKIGLAGLRIGWLYAPDHVCETINRLRGPFNVNVAAQIAATAAVKDGAFIEKLSAHNAQWRDWLTAELSSNHIRVLPSQANFVLALFEQDGPVTADAANASLLQNGIIVRQMASYGIPHGLRISIGTAVQMKAVAKVLANMERSLDV